MTNRRQFVARSAAAAASITVISNPKVAPSSEPKATMGSRQASGVKVGEVTENSAIVWARLTRFAERNREGAIVQGRVEKKGARPDAILRGIPVEQFEGACPGAPGKIRIVYSMQPDLADAQSTQWATVNADSDYSHCFQLADLRSNATYYYGSETLSDDGVRHDSIRGKFMTAPAGAAASAVTFCVLTCQAYHDRDHADGHNIYPSMLRQNPNFVVFTGDNVYYDSEEPRAVNAGFARHHWQRMFSLPRISELLRSVASYWEKDDHDTVDDDSWPGRSLGQLTFAEGQKIFRQQVPIDSSIYRTIRWGRDLQIWLTDGRDFRSHNDVPDGPDKTIWGKEQKEWLQRTLKESDATWKLLISPTPIVGPDRGKKADNHANKTFQHEGDEIRAWFQANVPDDFFVICGDRHWQYHSIHPASGLHEFSVGPASDAHAGGSPGEDKSYHRFHRVKGGFLSVSVRPDRENSSLRFQHRDVLGNVVYEWQSPNRGSR